MVVLERSLFVLEGKQDRRASLIFLMTFLVHVNHTSKLCETDKEWPILCLKIQDPIDVAQGIRILSGEESLGKICCSQLFVCFCIYLFFSRLHKKKANEYSSAYV